MSSKFLTVIVMTVLTSSGCGGGGGGGGGDTQSAAGTGATTMQAPTARSYGSALDFESPDTFQNGHSHSTGWAVVTVTGALNSEVIPRGYCPDPPPQNHTVRWTNEATGETSTVRVSIGCVTNNLFGTTSVGVASAFSADGITLNLGENSILFETFDGARKVGEDTIVIIRADRTAPYVTFRHPGEEASHVPSNHPIMVVFSEAMDPAFLGVERFTVSDASGNPVYGELVYDERHFAWRMQPDQPWTPGERYSVTISADLEDAGGGNRLREPAAWFFTASDAADAAAPALRQRWPGPACDCAPTTTRILTRFDEPILPGSVDVSSAAVLDPLGRVIAGTTVYAGDYLEFTPDSELEPGATYRVSVNAGLQDLVGNTLGQALDWEFTVDARSPAGGWAEMAEDTQVPAMSRHTAVWADPDVLFWSGSEGAAYTADLDAWSQLPAEGAPSRRFDHSAVWTGHEMIVWGGRADDAALASGGRYDPQTETWLPIQPPSAAGYRPSYLHVAAWTGTELLVWGGYTADGSGGPHELINQGWRYDPFMDSWSAMSVDEAPSARLQPVAVWNGSELVIWGGKDADGNLLEDGARYDPQTDSWTPITPVGAPRSHGHPFAGVWTGSEMIVWNGGALHAEQRSNTGYRQPTVRLYDPVADRWRVSETGWEPLLITRSIQDEPIEVSLNWTGDRMIALGGWSFAGIWAYDPAIDGWQELNREGGRFGYQGEAELWAGDRLVRWGGLISILPSRSGKVFLP